MLVDFTETLDILSLYGKELQFWHCYSVDKDLFVDLYDEDRGIYVRSINVGEEEEINKYKKGLVDYNNYKSRRVPPHKVGQFPGLDINISGLYYHIEKVCDNIGRDSFYRNFLVCYNFTSSVIGLYEYVYGSGTVKGVTSPSLCGYNYVPPVPVPKLQRISFLINENGIYVFQVKFAQEDHAMVFIVQNDQIAILHYYNELFTLVHNKQYVLRALESIEQNTSNNKLILCNLLGVNLLYNDYHIISLVKSLYWPSGITKYNLADYLINVVSRHFEGRKELRDIKKLISQITTQPNTIHN